jgi:tripartite ATP-independent transporter DctP family solute receptor
MNKFQRFIVTLTVSALTIVVLACSSQQNTSSNTATRQDPIVLKVGHDQPEASSYHAGMKKFADLVAERTGGRVRIDIYPNAVLGPEVKLLEGVRMGTLDIASCGAPNASGVVPELGLFSLSYLFRNQQHFDAAMKPDGEIMQILQKTVADKNAGVKMIGLFTTGKRSIVNSSKPIRSAADVKGMKIRVMASPVEQKIWSILGAYPADIATPETFTALQTKVVNAAENAPIIVLGWKWYEPAKYYSLTEHQFFVAPIFMSDKAYNRLPPDLRDMVLKAMLDASVYERQADIKINADALTDLQAKGAIINSDVNKKSFIDALKNLQDEVADQLKTKQLLDLIRNTPS